jgi:hypothetical protein
VNPIPLSPVAIPVSSQVSEDERWFQLPSKSHDFESDGKTVIGRTIITERYPVEDLREDDEDGIMPANVENLSKEVIGHKIVKVKAFDHEWPKPEFDTELGLYLPSYGGIEITLDTGRVVKLANSDDYGASTDLKNFMFNVEKIDHIITGIGTTDGFETWHIYADMGDVLTLKVDWEGGNGYYAFGFDIAVKDLTEEEKIKSSQEAPEDEEALREERVKMQLKQYEENQRLLEEHNEKGRLYNENQRLIRENGKTPNSESS